MAFVTKHKVIIKKKPCCDIIIKCSRHVLRYVPNLHIDIPKHERPPSISVRGKREDYAIISSVT